MNKPTRQIDALVRLGEEVVDEKVRLVRRSESAAKKAAEYDFHQAAVREVSIEDHKVYQATFDGALRMFRETCFELGVEVEVIEGYLNEVEEKIKAYHTKKFA